MILPNSGVAKKNWWLLYVKVEISLVNDILVQLYVKVEILLVNDTLVQ